MSGFKIVRLGCKFTTTDTLKQVNGSRQDGVCERALRKNRMTCRLLTGVPANIASCIRGVGCVESGVAGVQKVGCGQANEARLEGTGQLNWSPTISRFYPVLSRFTGHDSWLLSREAYQTVAGATSTDMATSSHLLRCHNPILVHDEVALSEAA
jgi:hypothetical protein